MKPITAIGKFLDQPLLVAKVNSHVPLALGVASSALWFKKMKDTPKEQRKKEGLKQGIILAATALSATAAPKIASKLTKRIPFPSVKEVQKQTANIADTFIKQNKTPELKPIFEKSKTKLLSLKEISSLFNKNQEAANKLIPPPDNIQAKDIFKEIGYLSVFGAVPVIGGITGGILADSLVEKNWKDKIPDKINEGMYQYLANIFMCNIGAGAALGILEHKGIQSKSARCLGMIGGIILTGVIGGSAIANFIGNKIVKPLISKDKKEEQRIPELLDISLHTDDIATVSLLSGLKWIEPALPLIYSISGYRAAIGYRNDENLKNENKK